METKKKKRPNKHEVNWENNFNILRIFNEHKKIFPLLQKDDQLKKWERYQNQLNNTGDGKLPEAKRNKLNSINFEWDESIPPLKSKEEKNKSSASSDVTSNDKDTIKLLMEENSKFKAKQAELEARIEMLSKK